MKYWRKRNACNIYGGEILKYTLDDSMADESTLDDSMADESMADESMAHGAWHAHMHKRSRYS